MQAPAIGGVRVRKGEGETIRLARGASLGDFADKIGADAASLVEVLFHLGEMVTATQSVNDDVLQILGEELNYDVQVVSPEEEDRELLESFSLEFGEDEGVEKDLAPRPPVVTVMGHVDHGKTKLLDALRDSNVVDKEAGGITQTIGAYQVATDVDGTERRITFIDTPGHEAFTAMRARGAQATDIAVLVVAADDGVMPQTVEALNHAKAAGVPIVVAVNKIDKPDADPSKARGQLTEYGLVPEEYGGDAMFVDVSAKAGTGLAELLESIILTADASLDLRANPDQNAEGLTIEAHLDRGRGPVATVLVKRGTLRVGDTIVAGSAFGRVRAMLDEHGDNIEEATPSRPALVLGLTAVPGAGDNFMVVDDDRTARQIAEKREARERNAALAKRSGRRTLEDFMSSLEKGETDELLLILKGDGSGSVEALEDALSQIDVGEEVNLRVIDRGVGAITETNVDLAAASNAVIIGFNVRPQGKATELADREGVEIKYYSVIYQAIDEIEAALKGMLKPEFEEAQLGTAEIRDIFRSSKIGNIAGCMVTSGTIKRNAKARLLRDGAVVADNLDLGSLRREKDDVVRGPRRLRVRHRAQGLQRHQGRRRHRDLRAAREGPGLAAHGGPAHAAARRPDQGDRRLDAGATGQGPTARLHHAHRRPAERRQPAGVGVLHRHGRPGGHPGHRGGAAQRHRPDPLRGRQAARAAAHAVAGVLPRRRARDGRGDRGPARQGAGESDEAVAAQAAGAQYAGDPDPYKKHDERRRPDGGRPNERVTAPPASSSSTSRPAGRRTTWWARVRRLAGTRKVGHAGTLDPMATGVLVLGVGRATRLLGHLQLADKEYLGHDPARPVDRHRRRRGRGRRHHAGRSPRRGRDRAAMAPLTGIDRAGAVVGLGDQGRRPARPTRGSVPARTSSCRATRHGRDLRARRGARR